MEHEVYNTREWRELPRNGECVAEFLFGDVVGRCRGLIHRHHVDPNDPRSRTYQACARHHPKIHAALRFVLGEPRWIPCPHKPGVHVYPGAREACERNLNHHAARRMRETAGVSA